MQTTINNNQKKRARRNSAGFTLVEAMVASGLMLLMTMACLTGIVFDEVAVRRAKEEAIVTDFLEHYSETIKALPFTSLVQGQPIGGLFNGANIVNTAGQVIGTYPNIRIPTNTTPVSLTSSDYQTFHPDLQWISDRNPLLVVQYDTNTVSGVLHDVHLSMTVTWNAPLLKGGIMQVQMDLLRENSL